MKVGDEYLRPVRRHNDRLQWEAVYVIGETRVSWLVSPFKNVRLSHPLISKLPKRDGMPKSWVRDAESAAAIDARRARSNQIMQKLSSLRFRPTDDQLDAIAKIMGWEV